MACDEGARSPAADAAGAPAAGDAPAPAHRAGGPPRFVALVGPTAVGKTHLSLPLAERLGAEIISMDSRQVYRGFDVGTAKASAADRARVRHHGLDLVEPGRHFSAARFARLARGWIDEIEKRRRVPLLVGGTGFFLRALLDPVFREPAMDPDRRERLRGVMGAWPRERLERWVRALDPERAGVAVAGGPQRMTRTLEVALLTGRPLSWWHREAPPDVPPVRGVVVVLERPRTELDRRIGERVDRMLEEGFLDEVRGLLDAGFRGDEPGMTATGYRELARHLRGELSLEEAAERIKSETRRYARRQLTWFRNQLPPDAVRLDARRPTAELADEVAAAWRRRAPTGGDPAGDGGVG